MFEVTAISPHAARTDCTNPHHYKPRAVIHLVLNKSRYFFCESCALNLAASLQMQVERHDELQRREKTTIEGSTLN